MNYKRFLELLNDEEVQDKIKDLYYQIDIERIEYSRFQGWRWSIILSEDGSVDYMYGSQRTTREDIQEGEAIVVAELDDNVDITEEDLGIVELTEDYGEFIEYLKNDFEYEVSPDEEDFKEQRERYIEESTNWENYSEFNYEGFRELEKQAWKQLCDIFSHDEIVDCIYNIMKELEDKIEYYESFEQEEF